MRSIIKRKTTKSKLSYFIVFTVFFVFLIFIITDAQLRPLMTKYAEYNGRIAATKIISTSVYNALNDDDFTYETLVKVTKNNTGYVSSIESNMAVINRLQATITYNINNDFKSLEKERFTVASGTLTGVNFMNGRGPDVTFMLEPVGYVDSKLISKFTPAGVNQTQHQIILEVQGKVSAIMPGFQTDFDVVMNYLIAETVVVGDIPESYTYITGDNRDNYEKVLDFKK